MQTGEKQDVPLEADAASVVAAVKKILGAVRLAGVLARRAVAACRRMAMSAPRTAYDRKHHAAAHTSEYLFNQLIPYIGNKRKLLKLIEQAIQRTSREDGHVRRSLRRQRRRVADGQTARAIASSPTIGSPTPRRSTAATSPATGRRSSRRLGGYEQAIDRLNRLPAKVGWVTEHLCPRDDANYDIRADRMFYMRKNGMRIDAIREQIAAWKDAGRLTDAEEACLLAPLVYQACYRSNTSGVFKGFHNGWGGQTKTALYRIATDLRLDVPVFHDNGQRERRLPRGCPNAGRAACRRKRSRSRISIRPTISIPTAATITCSTASFCGTSPTLSKQITRGTKAAIRLDWRTERRSAYNYREEASAAYRRLLDAINARYILTSYSTDGTIPLGRHAAKQRRPGTRLGGDARLQALSRQFAAILEEADERRVRAGARYARQEQDVGGRIAGDDRKARKNRA